MSAPSYVLGILLVLTGFIGYFLQTPYLNVLPTGVTSQGGATQRLTLHADGVPPLEINNSSASSALDHANNLEYEIMLLGNIQGQRGWYAVVKGEEAQPELRIFHKNGILLQAEDWTGVGINDRAGKAISGSLRFGKSPTALIPAIFGLIIIGCALGSQKKESIRKHLMHFAALVGLLGAVVPGMMAWSSYQENEKVSEKIEGIIQGRANITKPSPVKFVLQGVTATLCFFFLILCIQSFVNARKQANATLKPVGPVPGRRGKQSAETKGIGPRKPTIKDGGDEKGDPKEKSERDGKKETDGPITKPSSKPSLSIGSGKTKVPMPTRPSLKKPSDSSPPLKSTDSEIKDDKESANDKGDKQQEEPEKSAKEEDTSAKEPEVVTPSSSLEKPSDSSAPLKSTDAKDDKISGDEKKGDKKKGKKKKKKGKKKKKKEVSEKSDKQPEEPEKSDKQDEPSNKAPAPTTPPVPPSTPSQSSAPFKAPDSIIGEDKEPANDKDDKQPEEPEKSDKQDEPSKTAPGPMTPPEPSNTGPGPMPPPSALNRPSESSAPPKSPDSMTEDEKERGDEKKDEKTTGPAPSKTPKLRISGNKPIRINRPKPSGPPPENKENKPDQGD